MMKTSSEDGTRNPLLRTPGRDLRRHAVKITAATVILLVVLLLVVSKLGGGGSARQHNSPAATVTASTATTATADETVAATDTGEQDGATRTLSVHCETDCTLVLTATGDTDVQLTVSGPLSQVRPLVTDTTTATIRVTGSGTITATATAAGEVDLSVADESGGLP